jgi:hypothetical protein
VTKFILVLIAATVIGGFVGGELMNRIFSLTGAVVGGVGTAAVLLGLGAYFDSQEKKKPKVDLTPEIRAVFDRMLGRAQSGDDRPSPSRPTKAGSSGTGIKNLAKAAPQDIGQDAGFFISTVGALIAAQLLPKYSKAGDAFSALMTNQRAAGYVFGFHDALLHRLGLRDPMNRGPAASLIESSYRRLFGEQAGFVLFDKSVASQDDQLFHEGRMAGGNDLGEYLDAKVPPLGLGRMLILGMEA